MDVNILPVIPPQTYSYRMMPKFVRHWEQPDNKEWFLFGPQDTLRQGAVCTVTKASGQVSTIVIMEWMAQREVLKKNGNTVLFVLARFDNVMEEDNAVSGNDVDHGDAGCGDGGDPVVPDRRADVADQPTRGAAG